MFHCFEMLPSSSTSCKLWPIDDLLSVPLDDCLIDFRLRGCYRINGSNSFSNNLLNMGSKEIGWIIINLALPTLFLMDGNNVSFFPYGWIYSCY